MNINPIRIQMSVGVVALVGVSFIAFTWLLSCHGLKFCCPCKLFLDSLKKILCTGGIPDGK
jgi:hypothetical protein